MFTLSNNNIITITRGDSASFEFILNNGSTINPIYITLNANDKVYFGVSEYNKPFECCIIMKTLLGEDNLDKNIITVDIESKDTQFLLPGTYHYWLKVLCNKDGKEYIYTILDSKKFIIIE